MPAVRIPSGALLYLQTKQDQPNFSVNSLIDDVGLPMQIATSYHAWVEGENPDERLTLHDPVEDVLGQFPTRGEKLALSLYATSSTQAPPATTFSQLTKAESPTPKMASYAPQPGNAVSLTKAPPAKVLNTLTSGNTISLMKAPPARVLAQRARNAVSPPKAQQNTQIASAEILQKRTSVEKPWGSEPKTLEREPLLEKPWRRRVSIAERPWTKWPKELLETPYLRKSPRTISAPSAKPKALFKAPPPGIRTHRKLSAVEIARGHSKDAVTLSATYPRLGCDTGDWDSWMKNHPHFRWRPCEDSQLRFSVETCNEENPLPDTIKGLAKAAVDYLQEHHPQMSVPLELGDLPSTTCDVKMGLCISILNRKYQLQHVLPISLANVWRHRRWVKFYIVDFCSDDDVADWILNTFPEAIAEGFLHLYQVKTPTYFHASYFKNTAHRMAIEDKCDIVINIDADNIVSHDVPVEVTQKMNPSLPHKRHADAVHMYSGSREDGTYGRIACFSCDFEYMRGYDEDSWPVGAQDSDFLARLGLMDRRVVGWSISPSAIPNSKIDTCRHVGPSAISEDGRPLAWKEMDAMNGTNMKRLRSQGQIIRNTWNEFPFYGARDIKIFQN